MRKQAKRPRSSAMSQHHPLIVRQAEETVTHIRTLWRDLFRNPFAEAEEHGLTAPQVNVMAWLVSRGGGTLTELSGGLGMSHSTASGIVDRLQARGLIDRSEDPADRRRTVISVTGEVTQYVKELEFGPSGRVASALARATTAQRRTISEGLVTLRTLLTEGASESEDTPRYRTSDSRRSRRER